MISESAIQIIIDLQDKGFILGDILFKAKNTKLREYLKGLFNNINNKHNKYFRYFLEVFQIYNLKLNYDKKIILDAIAHLEKFPIIQHADHSNLLLDQETFLNNYL